MGGRIRIGISGWRYTPWRKVFYPEGLAQRRELEFASRMLPTLEINGSFYALQSPASWTAWRDATPPGFVFSVKAPRYITHILRLRDTGEAVANFFASGLLALNEKLGPLLWQLPPSLRFDPETLDAFLAGLPRDTAGALAIAQGHGARMAGRTHLEIDRKRPLRHALEVRHDSFVDPAFVALLRRHRVALVVADTGGRWPQFEDLAADFLYLRLHGPEQLYASGYTDRALDGWAQRIRAWRDGGQPQDARLIDAERQARPRASRDVYVYFDNDVKVHAPFDAAHLLQRLDLPSGLSAEGHFDLPPELQDTRPARPAKTGRPRSRT